MFQVPTSINASVPKEAIRLEDVNLIDYDFVKCGTEEMRSHLIDRWVKEIKHLRDSRSHRHPYLGAYRSNILLGIALACA